MSLSADVNYIPTKQLDAGMVQQILNMSAAKIIQVLRALKKGKMVTTMRRPLILEIAIEAVSKMCQPEKNILTSVIEKVDQSSKGNTRAVGSHPADNSLHSLRDGRKGKGQPRRFFRRCCH